MRALFNKGRRRRGDERVQSSSDTMFCWGDYFPFLYLKIEQTAMTQVWGWIEGEKGLLSAREKPLSQPAGHPSVALTTAAWSFNISPSLLLVGIPCLLKWDIWNWWKKTRVECHVYF